MPRERSRASFLIQGRGPGRFYGPVSASLCSWATVSSPCVLYEASRRRHVRSQFNTTRLLMEFMSVADNSSRSNACLDLPADFYWYGGGNGTAQEHISLAVNALMAAIKEPTNRRWNPYQEAMIRASFRKRLEKAAQGKLRPPGELKSLRGGVTLFEIRWRDIDVREVNSSGIDSYAQVEVRLIHAQPFDQLGLCILGLHAHEKVIVNGDPAATKAAQDAEIDKAEHLLISGYSTCWGVERRTQHD